MTNREYYNIMMDKADKCDRIMRELYTIKAEIIEHRRKTQTIDPYDLVGDCLDIVNKHILEVEEKNREMKDSYEIIADAVREFWKQEGFATDVIVFFNQKYSNEKEWEHCQELIMCHSDVDFDHVDFLSDFCEGQTNVSNIHIVELSKVTEYYYKAVIDKR